jgi:glycerol 2-dehydrogenase (NADP+)
MSLPKTFTIRLAGGKTTEIPSVGFGTWASDGSSPTSPANPVWIIDGLAFALDVGYRHLDGAWFYGVDNEIGEGLRKSSVPREELFITSKIWPNFYHPDAVEMCCDKILEGMKVDHLDCLLLHWPQAFAPTSLEKLKGVSAGNAASMEQKGMQLNDKGDPVIDWKHTSEPIAKAGGHPEGSIVPTWNAMKELVKKGKTRSIGVSNFAIKDLEALLPHAQDVPISVNQIECHPWHPSNELVEFGRKHGIVTSCFSPFAGQKADGATLIKDLTVQKLAKKNDMGVGQLLQSWAVQRGTIPLGKSGNRGESSHGDSTSLLTSTDRIKANFHVQKLSDEDMQALNDLEIPDGKGRTIDFTEKWGIKLWQN